MISRLPSGSDAATVESWLDKFHRGTPEVLEACYRDHFQTVMRAVGHVLKGADRETVVHDVFLELLSDDKLRRGFTGGGFAAWLSTIARFRAIDYWRRYRCERSFHDTLENGVSEPPAVDQTDGMERSMDARLQVEQFRKEALPAKWARVFETRFLAELDQRSAAKVLGISRTTLAYQEIQLRRLFKRFVLTRRPR